MTLAALARDDASAQFLDAAAQGVLLYQRCSACGHAQLPIGGSVRTRCRNCGRNEAAWTPASGAATLVSWTSSPVRTADGTEPGPVIGLLELAEGPWLETQLRGLAGAPGELDEGAPFHVGFEQPEGSEPIPVFIAG
ncbi:MAG: hypothetical protein JWN61_2575 [Pseudonocardiales bacterium]|nr:hypothetical protein [Pseudonocardiales bacterium]